MQKNLQRIFVGLAAVVSASAFNVSFAKANGWTFTVTNSGDSKIQRIEVSEDGREWGVFEDSSINPGKTSTFEWDASTNNSGCVWQIRAVYKDGPSEPAAFNFCKETELEFDN
ncbi:MAG: hypothetical protein VKJ46_06920 [Leptolyngbyaceae bacterium]|nr:hypothetical protein [Leptolyngbyaceae bacterium]